MGVKMKVAIPTLLAVFLLVIASCAEKPAPAPPSVPPSGISIPPPPVAPAPAPVPAPTPTPQPTPAPLQPPAPPWPKIEVHTDADKTIGANVGEEFAIALAANPRLGTNWYETYDENMLALVESEFVADTPLTPVAGTKWFLFKALKSGKTEITLTYKHGDSGPVRDQKVFRVDVK